MPELSVPGTAEGTARAAEWLRERCAERSVPEDAAHDLDLALDEVLGNILLHGYGPGVPGEIRLNLDFQPDKIRLEIRDRARPFDPLGVPEPELDRDLGNRPIGGLGVHILRSVMDRVEYVREDGENRLTLERKVHRS
jgi:anti-sigma regulatory factor (Ser/Thr protein kinase)